MYSTFFLSTFEQLVHGFPGWKLPLPAPVQREQINPFTKQRILIETREPAWLEEEVDEDLLLEGPELSAEGSYEEYLESRLPPFVRARSHWAATDLTQVEIRPLCLALQITPSFEHPIYGPPALGAMVQSLPDGFLAMLRNCQPEQTAARWAAAMSDPEHTHSASGEPLNDGWTVDYAADLLTPLIGLARRAEAGDGLYLLIEP